MRLPRTRRAERLAVALRDLRDVLLAVVVLVRGLGVLRELPGRADGREDRAHGLLAEAELDRRLPDRHAMPFVDPGERLRRRLGPSQEVGSARRGCGRGEEAG